VRHLKLQAIHTKYRKKLTFTNSAVPICTVASPTFTALSVPDTRSAFNFCCSFNWKPKTNANFLLSNITWALDTGELLGSRLGRFIPEEEGYYILTRGMCGPESPSGGCGGERKHSPLPEFEIWDLPAHSFLRSPTAQFSSRNLKLESLVTY